LDVVDRDRDRLGPGEQSQRSDQSKRYRTLIL
jgi:hypothetical protein